tara:strand:- start:3859 stop:19431 length:15573 start_codon:yes stop_codon:yes gene_type:complete
VPSYAPLFNSPLIGLGSSTGYTGTNTTLTVSVPEDYDSIVLTVSDISVFDYARDEDDEVIPFQIQVGTERMLVVGVDEAAGTLTVQRGSVRTVPYVHSVGATVVQGFTGLQTVLTSAITESEQTEIRVRDLTGFPETGRFDLRINDELLRVLEVTQDQTTNEFIIRVQRGVNGTTATTHVNDSNVLLLIDQASSNRFVDSNGDGFADPDIGAVEAVYFHVNTTSDSVDLNPGNGLVDTAVPGEISLRAAIMEANALNGNATIYLPAGIYTLDLDVMFEGASAGDLDIIRNLTIIGETANTTTIKGSISDRIFDVLPGVTLTLQGVTISAQENHSLAGDGGAIRVNQGALKLINSMITGTKAERGGAIWASGATVTVENSTIYSTSATATGGGIASYNSEVNLRNSTISGNGQSAVTDGGGIYNDTFSTLYIDYSTIAENSGAEGAGIHNLGIAHLSNTLIATNEDGKDISGDFYSSGFNLIGNGDDASLLSFEEGEIPTGDQVGSENELLDPLISGLGDHGGTTLTHALLSGSPALDAGNRISPSIYSGMILELDQYILEADATQITVKDTSGLPPAPFNILIDPTPKQPDSGDEEIIRVTEINNRVLTVERGVSGTTARRYINYEKLFPAIYDNSDSPAIKVVVLADQSGNPRFQEIDEYQTDPLDIGAYEGIYQGVDEYAPSFSISAETDPTTEGSGGLGFTNFIFKITRTDAAGVPHEIGWMIEPVGENPAEPSDFFDWDQMQAGDQYPTGTMRFDQSTNERTLTIFVTADTLVELNEDFRVVLCDAVTRVPLSEVYADETIEDDDDAAITVSIASELTQSEDGTFGIEVTMDHPAGEEIRLLANTDTDGLTATGGTDFTVLDNFEIVFAAGETSIFIPIEVFNDSIVETDEQFKVIISDLQSDLLSSKMISIVNSDCIVTITNDDEASLVVSDVTELEGDNGEDAQLVFQVTLSNPVADTVTVDFTTVNDTAVSGEDYVPQSGTLVFTAGGELTKQIVVPVIEDLLLEGDETFFVQLSNLSTGVLSSENFSPQDGVGTIQDDDAPRLKVVDVTESEDGTFTFNVELTKYTGDVTFDVSTIDGTAIAGEGNDYYLYEEIINENEQTEMVIVDSLTLSIQQNPDIDLTGKREQSFTVHVEDDTDFEYDEFFGVVLSNLNANGDEGDFILEDGIGTIQNNDSPSVTINRASGSERSGFLQFTATLAGDIAGGFSTVVNALDQDAVNGLDFMFAPLTLHFDGYNGETINFQVELINDRIEEWTPSAKYKESFRLKSEKLTIGSDTIRGIAGEGTIYDDDFYVSAGYDVDITYIQPGGNSESDELHDLQQLVASKFTELGKLAQQDPSDSENGTDLAVQMEALRNEILEVLRQIDQYKTDLAASQQVPESVVTVHIDDVTRSEEGTFEFTVTLDKEAEKEISVLASIEFRSATAADFVSHEAQRVIIPAGETSATFTVDVLDDTNVEDTEVFKVALSDAIYGDDENSRHVQISVDGGVGTGTIEDNDVSGVSISDTTVIEGSTASVVISLTNPVSRDVIVKLSASPDSASTADYETVPSEVIIPAGQTSVTIPVKTNLDNEIENDTGDESFQISIMEAYIDNGESREDVEINKKTAVVTISDFKLELSIDSVTQDEGGVFTFVVSLNQPVPESETISVKVETKSGGDFGTATVGEDYTALSEELIFNAGEQTKTVTVIVNDDHLIEDPETFTVELSDAKLNGAAMPSLLNDEHSATGTILNDDKYVVSISNERAEEEQIMSFTITLDQPAQEDLKLFVSTLATGTGYGYADLNRDLTSLESFPVEIMENQTSATVNISLSFNDFEEGDETFLLVVTGAESGGMQATQKFDLSNAVGIGTIEDFVQTIKISDATAQEGGVLTFTVSLDRTSSVPILVKADLVSGSASSMEYGTINGVNENGMIVFEVDSQTGKTALSKTITVNTFDDDLLEEDETFGVQLSNVQYGKTVEILSDLNIEDSFGSGTITNEDSTEINISEGVQNEDGTVSFEITLTNPASEAITVTANTSGSDLINALVDEEIVIPAGATSYIVTVALAGTTPLDNDISFSLGLSEPMFNGHESSGSIAFGSASALGAALKGTAGTGTVNIRSETVAITGVTDTDYHVSHAGMIKFSPFSEAGSYSSDDYEIIVNGSSSTVALKYGKLTINQDDFTVTYTPYDGLISKESGDMLQPEFDENGNIFRYLGKENIKFSLYRRDVTDVVLGRRITIAHTLIRERDVSLAVTNTLPVFIGDRVHDESGNFIIPTPIRIFKGTQYLIDLSEYYYDPDGDQIQIKSVTSTGNNEIRDDVLYTHIGKFQTGPLRPESERFLITKINKNSSILEVSTDLRADENPDFFSYSSASRTFTLEVTDGQYQPDSIDSKGISLTVAPVNKALPAAHSDLMAGVTVLKTDYYSPDDLNKEIFYDPLQWTLDAAARTSVKGDPNLQDVGGIPVDLNQGTFQLFHDLTLDGSGGASELSIPGLVYDSSTVDARPVIQAVVNRGAGEPVPLTVTATLNWFDFPNNQGENIKTTVTYIIDPDETNSLFDSQYTFDIQPDSIPMVTGVYSWELELVFHFDDNPDETQKKPDLIMHSAGSVPVIVNETVRQSDFKGGSKVIQPVTYQFGNGWSLAGVPTLYIDDHGDNGGNSTKDDLLILKFPGESAKVFRPLNSSGRYNYGTVGFESVDVYSQFTPATTGPPGSGEPNVVSSTIKDAGEFGTLTADNDTNYIYYTDESGTVYTFTRYKVNKGTSDEYSLFLITSIEAPASKPLLFNRDASGKILSITATDGTVLDLGFAKGSSLITSISGTGTPEVKFTYNGVNLESIQYISNTLSATSATPLTNQDRIRKFEYNAAGNLVKDQWFSQVHTGNTPVNVSQLSNPSKITNFYYTTTFSVNQNGEIKTSEILTGISLGNDPDGLIEDREASNKKPDLTTYYITPVGLAGLQRIDESGVPVTGPDDLVLGSIVDGKLVSLPFNTPLIKAGDYGRIARVELIVDDLQKLDVDLDIVEYSGRYITEYEYDINSQLIRRETYYDADIDSQGPVALGSEKWTYDHVGSVKTYMDPLGRVTYFGYDYEIPVTYATAEDDKDYDSSVAEEDRVGGTDATAKYDPTDYEGNVVYIIDLSGVTTFEYETDNETGNAVGTLVKSVDPRGTVTHYERNNEGQLTQLRTVRQYADDYTEEYSYYTSGDQEGLLKTFKDTLGLVMTYYYDGRRLSEKVEEDDSQAVKEVISTEYTYDSHGFIGSESIYDGLANTLVSATVYEYDGTGLLRDVEVFDNGSDVLAHTQYNYDGAGMVIDVIDGRGYVTHNDYDLRGLLLSTTKAQDATYRSYYLDQNLDIQEITTYSYYVDGSLKSSEVNNQIPNAINKGMIQTYYYDPITFTSWIDTKDPFGTQIYETKTDSLGRVTAEMDHLRGITTKYEYGDKRIDLPTSMTTQTVLGLKSNPVDLVTSYTYDAGGNLLSEHRDGAPAIYYEYDELGYLTHSSQDIEHSTSLEYKTNSAGQIVEQTETRWTLPYYPNFVGPINLSDDNFWDIQELKTTYEYDERGRLIKATDPVAAADTNDAELPVQSVYDIENGLLKVTSTSRTGVTTTQWFDALGRVVKNQNAFGGTTTFAYDLSGNLIKEQFQPATGDTHASVRNTAYHYDGLGRLRATEYQDSQGKAIYYAVTDYFRPKETPLYWQMATFEALTPDEYNSTTGAGAIDTRQATLSWKDLFGNVEIQHPIADSTGSNQKLTTSIEYAYYPANQTYTVTTRTPSGQLGSLDKRTTVSTYNSQGWLLQKIDTDRDHLVTSEYDKLGHLIKSTNGFAQVSTYEYTENHGQISKMSTFKDQVELNKNEALTTSIYQYDSAGNRTLQIGQNGDIEYFTYDALNRILTNVAFINTLDNNGEINGSEAVTRSWKYDGTTTVYTNRNLETITTKIDYASHQQTEKWDGDLNATYQFNSLGEIVTVTDSKNVTIEFDYNDLGRITEKKSIYGITIDDSTIYNPTVVESYGYELDGNRNQHMVSIAGASDPLLDNHYQIDANNFITNITQSGIDSAGKQINYRYTRDGQVAEIERKLSNQSFITKYGYRDDGKIGTIENLFEGTASTKKVSTYVLAYLNTDRAADSLDEQLELVRTSLFGSVDSINRFLFDGENQLEKETQYGQETELQIDTKGNILTIANASTGLRDRIYEDSLYIYKYDQEGRVIEKITKPIIERVIDNEVNEKPFGLSPLEVDLVSSWEGAEYQEYYRGDVSLGVKDVEGGIGGTQRAFNYTFGTPEQNVFAEYKFDNLTKGTYQVMVTWSAMPSAQNGNAPLTPSQKASTGAKGNFYNVLLGNTPAGYKPELDIVVDFSRSVDGALTDGTKNGSGQYQTDQDGTTWMVLGKYTNPDSIVVQLTDQPFRVSTDSEGWLLIADGVKIRRIDNDGKGIGEFDSKNQTNNDRQIIIPLQSIGNETSSPLEFQLHGQTWTEDREASYISSTGGSISSVSPYAEYTFQHLPIGQYNITASWPGGTNQGAIFVVKAGGEVVAKLEVDQDTRGSSELIASIPALRGVITVEIHPAGGQQAIAGAVSIERVEIPAVTKYDWDHRGRLDTVTFKDDAGNKTKEIKYYYNVFDQQIGRRVQDFEQQNGATQVSNTKFEGYVKEGHTTILELNEAAQLTKRYLVGVFGEIFAVDIRDQEQQLQTRWAVTDYQDNVVFWLKEDVQHQFIVDQQITYSVFGLPTQIGSDLDLEAMMKGSSFDFITRLYTDGGRVYDPQFKRYLSENPAGISAINLYAYAANSPVLPNIPGNPSSYSPSQNDYSENAAYSNSINQFIGNYVIRNLVDDQVLARRDVSDLSIVGIAATEFVGLLDPTGIADLTAGSLYFAIGDKVSGGISLAGVLIPFGFDKIGKVAVRGAKAGTKVGSEIAQQTGKAGLAHIDDAAALAKQSPPSVPQGINKGYVDPADVTIQCFVAETPVMRRMDSDSDLLAAPAVVKEGEDDSTTVWLVGGIAGLITLNQLTKHKEKKPKRKTSPRSADTDQWLEENDWTRLISVPEKREPEWNLSAEDIDGICQELLMGSESRSSFSSPRSRQLPVRETVSRDQEKFNPINTNPIRKGEKTVSPKESQSSVSEDTRTVKKKSLFKSVLQKMVFFSLTLLAGFCLWKMAPVLNSQKTPVHTIPVDEAADQPGSPPALKAAVEEQGPPEEKNAFLSTQQKGGDV